MSTITKPTFDPHPMFSDEYLLPRASGGDADKVNGGGLLASPTLAEETSTPPNEAALLSSPALAGEVSAPADGGGLPSSPNPHSPVPNPYLLDDLLDPHLTPSRICQLHNLTLAQLRTITQSDEFKQALEDNAAINESRRESIRDQLHTQALAAASDLINEAAELNEQNRTCTTNPRPQPATNPEAHRRALSAATRQHATNARLLETRRKTINTILKECKPKHPIATPDPRRNKPSPATPDHLKPDDTDASPVSLPAPSRRGGPPKAGRRGLPHSPQLPVPQSPHLCNTTLPPYAKEHPAQTGRVWRENDSSDRIAASGKRSRHDDNF